MNKIKTKVTECIDEYTQRKKGKGSWIIKIRKKNKRGIEKGEKSWNKN